MRSAEAPRQTRNSGSASSICRSMKGRQTLRLLGRRSPVAGRAPGNDIGDVDAPAIKPDRSQHPVEQLPRPADERAPDPVFVRSRRLADEHDPRAGDAVGEHELGRGPLQGAAVEIRHDATRSASRSFAALRERASRNLGGVGRHGGADLLPAERLSLVRRRRGPARRLGRLRGAALILASATLSANRSWGVSSSASVTPERIHQRSASAASSAPSSRSMEFLWSEAWIRLTSSALARRARELSYWLRAPQEAGGCQIAA